MTETINATILGHPRIGPKRELKRAVEKFWKGDISHDELEKTADQLIVDKYEKQKKAQFDSVPVNDFSYYDQMLDASALLGTLPKRVQNISDPVERYFAAARGNAEVEPLEMTKWFNTNYHFLVPELSATTEFSLHPEKILHEIDLARQVGVDPRPVLIGPVTYLLLSKSVDGSNLLDLLPKAVPVYQELFKLLSEKGISWVQLDEAGLIYDLTDEQINLAASVYEQLAQSLPRPKILLATYFGLPTDAVEKVAQHVDGISVDLVSAGIDLVEAAKAISPQLVANKLALVGVVDGRNVWRTDLEKALAAINVIKENAGSVGVSSSSSLLHVPYTVEAEEKIDPTIKPWLSFADEKIKEISILSTAVQGNKDQVAQEFADAAAALEARAKDPRTNNPAVRERAQQVTPSDYSRIPFAQRIKQQNERLGLPLLPTTTIGSFPQTIDLRVARQKLAKKEISEEEYTQIMREYTRQCIQLQEELELDVLVHGEPERSDMVEFFSNQLEGFYQSTLGWVQSYGSRCVRPPILYGDVARPQPMTVDWATYAQSLTEKPVKGMLTGPVTIIAWSFVRDDQPLSDTAVQLALAIREETLDLEKAGIKVIQVDEPALRELLPLRSADKPAYLDWAVNSFRLSTSGVQVDTQIHTHLCYSEFGEVIGSILDLDADVTSIEAARSKMEILDDLKSAGFSNDVGPGVYDIHSPRVPSTNEIEEKIRLAVAAVPIERLWINPDCGLKTRSHETVVASLSNVIAATKAVRKETEPKA